MKNRIITISRQFGSGGRTIGKQVAEKLGIPCYDQELLVKLAETSGFDEEYLKKHSESYTEYGGWNSNAMSGRMASQMLNQDLIWWMQRDLIKELAAKGSCVFVGRCANYILRDDENADCLNVFIYADMESRAKRIVERYGERTDSPEKRLKESDKRRQAYYQYYTDMQWADTKSYHLCLDSSVLGIDKCAELIEEMY